MLLSFTKMGIRKIVNNQFPSESIRGRSSVSAISCKNAAGTFNSFSRKSKSSGVGHSTFTQQLGSQLGFSIKPATKEILSHCVAPFFCIPKEPARFDIKSHLLPREMLILLVYVREFESSMIYWFD